jgi:hypothetical protein
MKIKISESHYKAMGEAVKNIPTELVAKETESAKGNKGILVECRHGPLMRADEHNGSQVVAIVRAANLMREIYYNAEINRLQEERDGYDA